LADEPDQKRSAPTGQPDVSDVRARLDALESKLEARRPDPVDEKAAAQDRSNMALALRISADFIAAVLVGGALGWFLDQMAGTTPFGLIVLLLLGFAAGVLNVMRTLKLVVEPRSLIAPSSDEAAARRDDTGNKGREGG
jgi:ATP synthase protein I